MIAERAREDARRGDPKPRQSIGELLLGTTPESLTTLAATELAGTLDQEIQALFAGLRVSVQGNSPSSERIAGTMASVH